MNVNKETMLRRLQAADFVLHETVLYLDGHPTNQKALEFFRKAKAAYRYFQGMVQGRCLFGTATVCG